MTEQEFKSVAAQYCKHPIVTMQGTCMEFQEHSGVSGRYTPGQGWELFFNGAVGTGATHQEAYQAMIVADEANWNAHLETQYA